MAENKIDYSLLLNIIVVAINPLIFWLTSRKQKKPSITHRIIWKNAQREKEKLRSKLRMDIIDIDLEALKKIAKIEIDKSKSATETIQKEFISEVADETITKTTKLTENLKDKLKNASTYINPLLEKVKKKED